MLPFTLGEIANDVSLKEIFPNIKCIAYSVKNSHIKLDDHGTWLWGPANLDRLEEWVRKAGDVELRRHIV